MPEVSDYEASTEYSYSYGAKTAKLPPAHDRHRVWQDATSTHIGLPDPGLLPAAAIPTWASPLYMQKPPPGHYTPASTLITGATPPASFANIFMYKSIAAESLR